MMSDRQRCEQRDFAADWLTLVALWGLPTVAMLLALLLDPKWRAVVWIAMLCSLRDKRSPLWPHALSVHRTVFSRHGRLDDRSHCRLGADWQPTLAGARHPHCGRQCSGLVGQ
jgi:hypothetical protein